MGFAEADLAHYEPFWSSRKGDYVLTPVRFPDGSCFYDIYHRDGTYSTPPDPELNATVVERMLAAGVQLVDPDAWVRHWRDLMDHELLWTKKRHLYVVAKTLQSVSEATTEIYDLSGEVYPVSEDLREHLIDRMLAAGVPKVEPDSLQVVLAGLREAHEKAELRAHRIYRSCMPPAGRIPRAWLKHRIQEDGQDGHENPVAVLDRQTGKYLLASENGEIPFSQIRSCYPSLFEKIRPGDELWWFKSPSACWDQLMGRSGYCLVQGRQPIVEYVVAFKS